MVYISSGEAAGKWGVHIRIVQKYCLDGRIPGAVRRGRAWFIPENSAKPADPRRRTDDRHVFLTLPRECPELIMTALYSKPGSADSVAEQLSDCEAQRLFRAELAYFRGETDSAKAVASELLASTRRPDVRSGCAFVLCLAAMYNGDAEGWITARNIIAEMPCRTSAETDLRDFRLGSLDSGLYDRKSIPEWFRDGELFRLPPDCFPFARLIYMKWIMISQEDPDISLLRMFNIFVSQSRAEGALLSEIYCLLLAAFGYHDKGMLDKASALLDTAIEKALPDRLYSPLAEYRNELGVLLDERLLAVDKNAAAEVRSVYKRLITGWATLCRDIRGLNFATSLTTREHHAAKLAARGLGNVEIAARMKLSVNTVKRYISEAVAKSGAGDRTGLAAFVAYKDGDMP